MGPLKMWVEHAMDIWHSSSSCCEMDLLADLCTDGMMEWIITLKILIGVMF